MDQRGAIPLSRHDPVLDGEGLPLPSGRGRCNMAGCGFAGPIEDTTTAQARMVWHTFTKHPEVWKLVAGDREPQDPRPTGPLR